MEATEFNKRGAVGGGVIAGLVAGLMMAVLMVGLALSRGADPWPVLKGAASPFLGERAVAPGPDVVAVAAGLACHLAVAAIWGLLFGVLFYGLNRGLTLVVGLFYGLVVWLAMYYVVLPLLGRASLVRSVPIGLAALEHVVFGFTVAVAFLPFQREIRLPRLQRHST